jgi:hypothetical protein
LYHHPCNIFPAYFLCACELRTRRLRTVLGESLADKRARLLGVAAALAPTAAAEGSAVTGAEAEADEGPEREEPQRDLRCFIVKTNDDLRQEVCCLQLVRPTS